MNPRALTDAQRTLAAAHWGDARRIALRLSARQYKRFRRVTPEDCASDGLIRAARLETISISPVVLRRCVTLAYIDQIRGHYGSTQSGRRPRPTFHQADFREEEGEEIASPEEPVDVAVEYEDTITHAAGFLPPKTAAAFLARFLYPCRRAAVRCQGTQDSHVAHAQTRLREVYRLATAS